MEYLIHIITAVGFWGYVILFVIVFFESFPPTFFLPGDSLLFTTGVLASQGYFNLPFLILTLFVASVFGYIFSYFMGKKLRDFILNSNDRYWFKKKHLDYTENFYHKYGAKTVIIGRFIAVVRSFSPTLAGAVKMDYKKFVKLAIIGGLVWTVSITVLGYYLGKVIPGVDKYLTFIILGIICLSFIPSLFQYISHRLKNKNNPE